MQPLQAVQVSPHPLADAPAGKLRVLLDARKLGDGGIGVYIRNLISGLLAGGEVDLTAIVKSGARARFSLPEELDVIEDDAKSYSFDEMLGLPKRIDFSRFNLFHEPHYTLPYGIPIPTVATIHDLIHLNYPEKIFIPYLARFLIRSTLKRADRVVTVSNASLENLKAFAANRPGQLRKMSVVPNAVDQFFRQGGGRAEAPHQRCCKRYFLSILSNLKPHKGVPDLLKAFQLVRERLAAGCDWKLVLLGEGTQSIVEREQLLEEAALIKGVKIVGRVSKEELRSWYAGAEALVVPSKEEGFCLPVLEAQAVGTPVISRPIAAVRELLLPGDRLCRDLTVESLAECMLDFMQKSDVPEISGSAERDRHLDAYTPEVTARSIVSIYRQALAGR